MRFSRLTSFMLEAVTRLAFPAKCVLCQQSLDLSKQVLCLDCKQSLGVLKPPYCETCSRPFPPYAVKRARCSECLKSQRILKRLYAVVPFDTTHRLLLHKIKFGKRRWVLNSYQPLIERFIRDQKLDSIDRVVPVPLDSSRKRSREFNQAQDLAERVAKRLNVVMDPDILKRRGVKRQPQSVLKRKERLLNLKGLFFVKQSRKVENRSILLVDDIYTTGATIHECANALKEAGAREISAFVLARTI